MSNRKPIARSVCTTRDAAELLGISLRSAQLWCDSGLLEASKTRGGHRRISRESIERLLKESGKCLSIGDGTIDRPGTPEKFRILVLESDPALRRICELRLRGWPINPEVLTTGDGYEALIQLGLQRPDMMIFDLQTPGLDTVRILHTFQRMRELADMAIVVVSNPNTSSATPNSMPDGIFLLPKPVPFDRLATIAKSWIDQRHSR